MRDEHAPPPEPWTSRPWAVALILLLTAAVWAGSMWMATREAPALDLSGDSVQTPTVEVITPHSGGGRLVP